MHIVIHIIIGNVFDFPSDSLAHQCLGGPTMPRIESRTFAFLIYEADDILNDFPF